MAITNCPSCGAPVSDKAPQCPKCGAILHPQMSTNAAPMSFGTAVSTCFSKYAVFSGRATRAEYWWFYLATLLMSFAGRVIGGRVIGGFLGIEIISTLVTLAILYPSLAVGVRRMHDVGKSGWYLLIPIYNLILLCTPSEPHPNKYNN